MNKAIDTLAPLISPVLERRGFKFRKSDASYFKREKFGFLYFSLVSHLVSDSGGYYVVEYGLGARHDRVDNIVNQLGHIWGDAYRKRTTTVYRGLTFFPFDSKRDGRQLIHSSNIRIDAAAASDNIVGMLEESGLDFYDRYSSLVECARGLNVPIGLDLTRSVTNFLSVPTMVLLPQPSLNQRRLAS